MFKYLKNKTKKLNHEKITYRNRNCRLRLETSIVSMSITWICLKPDSACEKRVNFT